MPDLRSKVDLLFKVVLAQKLQEKLEKAQSRPNDRIRQVADQYAAQRGIQLNHAIAPVKVDRDHAAKIALAYHQMKHDPSHPEVKSAYDALVRETGDQYAHIKNTGLKIEPMPAGMENPYKNGSKDLFHDIENNNHMWYYPTSTGYGAGAEVDQSHPMLQTTQHLDEHGKPMMANDMFRIVHDYFGHAKEGFGFGPNGEENAWRHHMQMYSPEAQKALTSETRGQNSWVNFGPHGEHNRANPHQTIYADQKAGLLPDLAYKTVTHNALEDDVKKSEALRKTPFQYDYEQDPSNATHDYDIFNDSREYKLIHNVKLPNGLQYRQYQHKKALPHENNFVHTIFHPGYDTNVAVVHTANEGPEYHGAGRTVPNVVQWSEVHPLWRGKGLGKQAYLAALLHGKGMEQGLSSDTWVSPAAHKVWLSFRSVPGLKGLIGRYAKDPNQESQRHQVYVADASQPQHNSIFRGHFSDYMPKPEKLAASEHDLDKAKKKVYRKPATVQISDLHQDPGGVANAHKTFYWTPDFKVSDKPVAVGVHVKDGKMYLLNGYHRVLAAQKRGDTHVQAELVPTKGKLGHPSLKGYEDQFFHEPATWEEMKVKKSEPDYVGEPIVGRYKDFPHIEKDYGHSYLMWPVTINDETRDPVTGHRYHITLRHAGEHPPSKHFLDYYFGPTAHMVPDKFELQPHIFDTPNGRYHVLKLTKHPQWMQDVHKGLEEYLGPDKFPNYIPHISVPKHVYDRFIADPSSIKVKTHPIEMWRESDTLWRAPRRLAASEYQQEDLGREQFGKSEELNKSKNVREQRADVFGTKDQPPAGSEMREKHMKHISKFAQDFLQLKIHPSGGKWDEKKNKRRPGYDKPGEDKPDWRSGRLEAQWNPNAMIHEIAHLMLLPKGVGLKAGQSLMDKQYSDIQSQYGYMKQKKHSAEVQPMAAEQLIRRYLGLPANKYYTEAEGKDAPPYMSVEDPPQVIGTRVNIGKKKEKWVDLVRQSRFLTPENRQRIEDVLSRKIIFHPLQGWIDNPEHARARQIEERRQKKMFGDKIRFKDDDDKLAASEEEEVDLNKGGGDDERS